MMQDWTLVWWLKLKSYQSMIWDDVWFWLRHITYRKWNRKGRSDINTVLTVTHCMMYPAWRRNNSPTGNKVSLLSGLDCETDTWLYNRNYIIGQTWPKIPILCATVLQYHPVIDVSAFQTTAAAVLAQCPSRERFGSCSLNGDPMGIRHRRISSHTTPNVDPSSYPYCRCGTQPSPTTARQGPEWSSQSHWPRPPRSKHHQAPRNWLRPAGLGVLCWSWNMLELSISITIENVGSHMHPKKINESLQVAGLMNVMHRGALTWFPTQPTSQSSRHSDRVHSWQPERQQHPSEVRPACQMPCEVQQRNLHPLMLFIGEHWPLTFPAPITPLSFFLSIWLHYIALVCDFFPWMS